MAVFAALPVSAHHCTNNAMREGVNREGRFDYSINKIFDEYMDGVDLMKVCAKAYPQVK